MVSADRSMAKVYFVGGRMLESKYLCTYGALRVDPRPRRKQEGHAGNLRVERDDENLVEIAPRTRWLSGNRARIRARTAVYALLGLKREPPAVYKGKFDPRVLFAAFMALHDVHS